MFNSQASNKIDLGTLHPKQSLLYQTKANEVLYGGAAGGGKSHAIRSTEILWCTDIPGLQVYLFRRQSVDLEKNHLEGPMGFRAMLAPWVQSGLVAIVQGEIRFWNGSKIYLCHCKDPKDVYKYQGAEMHICDVDEATHFEESMLRYIRTRVRLGGFRVPEHYYYHEWDNSKQTAVKKCMFPKMRYFTNPGNVGHAYIKSIFVDEAQRRSAETNPYPTWQAPKEDGGMLRQFIPARLEDNPTMAEHDPDYEDRLMGVGSPEVAKALRYGDWNVIAGSFFPEFGEPHILQIHDSIPDYWTRFMSFDWGYAKPFSCLWFAVADGEWPKESPLPKGSLVIYDEWYGANGPDKGLRMTVEEVAHGILAKERGRKLNYRVADPAVFTADGGPSFAERFSKCGVRFKPADNKRIAGWDELRERLRLRDSMPMLFVQSSCKDLIRLLPLQQHDERKPEDLNTDLEDHSADCLRYGVMSRPMVKKRPEAKKPMRGLPQMTFNELMAAHDREMAE